MRIIKSIFGISFAVIIMALSSGQALANSGTSLSISPPTNVVTTKPNSSVSVPIKVENNGSSPIVLRVSLMKFGAYGTSGKALLTKFKPSDTYAKWVTFSKTNLTANPGVWETDIMTINVPASAMPSYYYAVLFTPVSSASVSGNGASLNGSITSLVLLNVVSSHEKRQLKVVSFTSSKWIYEYLPASFSVKVKNTGNTFIAPSGAIYISKNKVNDIATLNINPNQGNILSDSERVYKADWSNGFPVFLPKKGANGKAITSNGQIVKQLSWNWSNLSKFRFGHYYAHLTLVYNNGVQDIQIQGNVSFWVIPWKILLVVIFLIALIVWGIYSLIRSRRRIKRLESSLKLRRH